MLLQGAVLPRLPRGRARPTLAGSGERGTQRAGRARGGVCSFRAPRSGALGCALSPRLRGKAQWRPSGRRDRGSAADGAPTWGGPGPHPRPSAGRTAGERGRGAPAPRCAPQGAGGRGWGRVRRGRSSNRGGGGVGGQEPTRCRGPSPARETLSAEGARGAWRALQTCQRAGRSENPSQRQRVAFVSAASLCHLRALARGSARLGKGQRGGFWGGSVRVPRSPPPGPRPQRARSADCFPPSRHAWAGKILNAA